MTASNGRPPAIRTDPERNALEAQAANSPAKLSAQPYKVWATFSGGKCVLNWSATSINTWDWIGMFRNADDALNNPNDHVISPGDKTGWQWAERGSSYKSSTDVNDGLVIAYISGAGSTYQAVAISDPIKGPSSPG